MKGIYKFTNNITKKSYIGQSINLESRYNSHKRNYLNKNLSTYNSKFYRAIRKYGFENFTYEILCQSENYTVEELNYYEQLYIKQYNSFLDGYNMNYGGDATGGNYFIPQDVINIQIAFYKKTLSQIYEDYKEILSFSELKKIVYGVHFQHLPIYKKRKRKWYLNGTCIDYPYNGE